MRHSWIGLAGGAGLMLAALSVNAEIVTEVVEYEDGEVPLKGYLVWDDAIEGERPGVLVVHEWWGLNDYVVQRAQMLAELGYVAFAGDMYGKDKVTDHGEQAQEWMSAITANVDHWVHRARLGLDVLRRQPQVDSSHLAAIGYCFGGATVMQIAYAGTDLDGVVSFHGTLPIPTPEQAGSIRAAILAAHGAADSLVPREQVDKFESALAQSGADWELAIFSGARHGFTNPNAGSYGFEAVQYNERADKRSWQMMQGFLAEVFGAGS